MPLRPLGDVASRGCGVSFVDGTFSLTFFYCCSPSSWLRGSRQTFSPETRRTITTEAAIQTARPIGSEGDIGIKPHRVRRNVAIDVSEYVAAAAERSNRTLYIVTATYPRPEQEAELLRLSQTLMHVRPLVFWVLVEDARRKTPAVTELLQRSRLRHVHLLGT